MIKKIIVTTFNEKTNDQEFSMYLTLRTPVEGNTFIERKHYIIKMLSKRFDDQKYMVQWKDPFNNGALVGFLVINSKRVKTQGNSHVR